MEELIKRAIDKAYPELKTGSHLPKWGQVVAVREPVTEGDLSNAYRPRYAVSVQLLDSHGNPDPAYPVLHDVPLSTPMAGNGAGRLAYPPDGARVEVAFAGGSPNNPFIRGTLPHNVSLPAVAPGEVLDQHSPGSYQRVDPDGNRYTVTDGLLSEDSLKRLVEAVECVEHYTKHSLTVDAELVEIVGAGRTMKAMGFLALLSGGRLDISALGELNISSQGQIAAKAPLVWVGNDSENLLALVSELLGEVKSLCTVLASHTHPSTGAIDQSAAVAAVGDAADAIKGRLDGFVL